MSSTIDTTFDFRNDARGKDPDSHSPTLRRYHKRLWSKPLPDGRLFELDESVPGSYLHHRSEIGEFSLASDSVIPTFTYIRRMAHIVGQITAAEREAFVSTAYTIGGMMIFPANRVDGKMTINGARGFSRTIADRWDLTVECIRRHYLGGTSPLGDVFERYSDFFRLFGDFAGYITFFLLEDIVNDDCSSVRFFLPFDDFRGSPLPADLNEYVKYRQQCVAFLEARNRRISANSGQ